MPKLILIYSLIRMDSCDKSTQLLVPRYSSTVGFVPKMHGMSNVY